jgi:3,5-epimerase/4-reductase
MNLLIYGHNGWIGSQFIELLNLKNISYTLGISRTDNYNTLIKEIEEIKPTHIVSFIGRTHGKIGDKNYTTIDYLEQEGKLYENIRDNLYSPLLLAKISTDLNIHYTYLGTGCIFNYDNEHPYGLEQNGFTENDKANFFGSSYSTVKGFTDSLMKLFDKNVLQLRIRMPITGSKNGRNFITKITNYEKICSIPNSMTVLPQLLPIALDMIQKNTVGTFNFTNPGLITHNEILTMYKNIVDNSFTWTNFTIDEQNQILDSKRSNNFLDTSKLENLYEIDNIKDAVKKMLIEYKNSL